MGPPFGVVGERLADMDRIQVDVTRERPIITVVFYQECLVSPLIKMATSLISLGKPVRITPRKDAQICAAKFGRRDLLPAPPFLNALNSSVHDNRAMGGRSENQVPGVAGPGISIRKTWQVSKSVTSTDSGCLDVAYVDSHTWNADKGGLSQARLSGINHAQCSKIKI